jgi:hypothetical protein
MSNFVYIILGHSVFSRVINYFLSSTPSWCRKTYSLSIVVDKELDVRLMSFLCVTTVSAATKGLEQSRKNGWDEVCTDHAL